MKRKTDTTLVKKIYYKESELKDKIKALLKENKEEELRDLIKETSYPIKDFYFNFKAKNLKKFYSPKEVQKELKSRISYAQYFQVIPYLFLFSFSIVILINEELSSMREYYGIYGVSLYGLFFGSYKLFEIHKMRKLLKKSIKKEINFK